MNAIHQLSLKLRLGIDPSSNIQSDQLLQKWQAYNARRCASRSQQRLKDQHSTRPADQRTGSTSN